MGTGRPTDLGVVIVAAGFGNRFGDAGKVFATLAGRALLEHSLQIFSAHDRVEEIVLVLGDHTLERGRELVARLEMQRVTLVAGGATRTDSVRAGVAVLDPAIAFVAVHDAARPLLSSELFQRLIDAATRVGAAVPVVSVTDTVYVASPSGVVDGVLDRSTLRAAQTPQIARRDWLEDVLDVASDLATDEGSLLHAAGYPVALVDGDPENIKITQPCDLLVAEAILAARGRVV